MSINLGQFISDRLRDSRRTQEDLGTACYVRVPTVSRWIHGATPEFGRCVCIAMFFDVSVDHIINLSEDTTLKDLWHRIRLTYIPYGDETTVRRLSDEIKDYHRRFAEILEGGGAEADALKNVIDTYWQKRKDRLSSRHKDAA